MEKILMCPNNYNDKHGAMCKRVKGGKEYVCKFLLKQQQNNPATGEPKIVEECAEVLSAIAPSVVIKTIMDLQKSLDNMKNESLIKQDLFLDMVKQSVKRIDRQ